MHPPACPQVHPAFPRPEGVSIARKSTVHIPIPVLVPIIHRAGLAVRTVIRVPLRASIRKPHRVMVDGARHNLERIRQLARETERRARAMLSVTSSEYWSLEGCAIFTWLALAFSFASSWKGGVGAKKSRGTYVGLLVLCEMEPAPAGGVARRARRRGLGRHAAFPLLLPVVVDAELPSSSGLAIVQVGVVARKARLTSTCR
jgi:hypothetical protein